MSALLASQSATRAYSYRGSCGLSGNQNGHSYWSWDIVFKNASNINGAQMNQYSLPASTDWVTCTYSGSGFGHMDELLSLQGDTGIGQIVQIGIAKYTGPQGISWLFIYTDDDNSGGVVVGADDLFGESPSAGRRYHFSIQYDADATPPHWLYCIKDIENAHLGCWWTYVSWYTSSEPVVWG